MENREDDLEKKIFKVFPIISLWELRPPGHDGQYGPQGYGWQDLFKLFIYLSCGPHGLRKEDF